MTLFTDELMQRCAGIPSSTWADALDVLGIEGVMQGIALRAGSGRIVGTAETARQVPGRLGDFGRADFAVGRLVAATGPGKVLLVDVGGAEISTFGGIASTAAALQKATGVIIDGACRDVDEIREAGLWMASRHVSPRTGKGRLKLVEMGGAVSIGGVTVRQGDLIVGDDTGIVAIPQESFEAVLAAAEEALAVDDLVLAGVKSGKTFADAAAAANYIPKVG